jgi:hypothetical protein
MSKDLKFSGAYWSSMGSIYGDFDRQKHKLKIAYIR